MSDDECRDGWEGFGDSETTEADSLSKSNGSAATDKSTRTPEGNTAKRPKQKKRKLVTEKTQGHSAINSFGMLETVNADEESAFDTVDGER